MFRIGQKVVVVNAIGTSTSLNGGLIEGSIHVVRAIGITTLGEAGIKINGYEYSTHPGQVGKVSGKSFVDNFLRASRFRPLIERKTDISFAHEILRKVTKQDRVRA